MRKMRFLLSDSEKKELDEILETKTEEEIRQVIEGKYPCKVCGKSLNSFRGT